MTAIVKPHRFPAEKSAFIRVPASKSHTIRRLIIATLAEGVSEIEHPLDSLDTRSCVSVCRALGAEITELKDSWTVRGIAGGSVLSGARAPSNDLISCDAGNSGTTFFSAVTAASLWKRPVELDGDEQLRRRSIAPLLEALSSLGVSVKSGAEGRAPVTVRGPWKGGRVSLPCPTSQYLSAMLLASPLAPSGVVTEIDVPLLNEKPYVEMTLSYLDSHGIAYNAAPDFSFFRIPGGGSWKPVNGAVPADFSSAAFPLAAAAISGGSVTLLGLDPDDTQGDKAVAGFLEKMGCRVRWEKMPQVEWRLELSGDGNLKGGEFDLNDTPDLLPVMAAIACFAEGDTALVNAAHARIKETDRIAVMAEELGKLGVKTSELPDGLVVHGAGGIPPKDGNFKTDGHGDHRVVMALACAALGCPSPVEIAGAESAAVTYPGFLEMLGADSL